MCIVTVKKSDLFIVVVFDKGELIKKKYINF